MQNLIYLTYLAELLPLLLCLFFVKRIKSTELKVFFFYTLSTAFLLCLVIYYNFVRKDFVHRLVVNRVFLAVEFCFLSVYYYKVLVSGFKKVIFPVCITVFLLYSGYDYYFSKPGEFTFIPLVIECLFFLLVIIYYFYEKIQYHISSPIYYSPGFWISVAFLIYFSGNFFLFLFSKTMFKDPNFRIQYTTIYSTVTIIKNIFLCTAIGVNAYLVKEEEKKSGLPIDIDLGTFNPLANNTNH